MRTWEIRNIEEGIRYMLEGLWLARVVPPPQDAAAVAAVLEWAARLVAEGAPLPPLSFVSDVGLMASGHLWGGRRHAWETLTEIEKHLIHAYEDRFLARIPLDRAFDRAIAAIARYAAAERPKAITFLLKQLAAHLQLGGAYLSLETIRRLQTMTRQMTVSQIFDQYSFDTMSQIMRDLYVDLIQSLRRVPFLLPEEDVAALEDRSALGGMAQFVALRQIRQIATLLDKGDGLRPSPVRSHRRNWLTRIRHEDRYPVGGFASITTRGSMESLLHSQLAYMDQERPDLFDIKYVRDELLYYSRDENNFIISRRDYIFIINYNIIDLRFKDLELPYERIVLLLSWIIVIIRRLTQHLTHEAIHFEIRLIEDSPSRSDVHKLRNGNEPWEEQRWLELLLKDWISRGTAAVGTWKNCAVACEEMRNRCNHSDVYCLYIAPKDSPLDVADGIVSTHLILDGPRPCIATEQGEINCFDVEPLKAWSLAIYHILEKWL